MSRGESASPATRDFLFANREYSIIPRTLCDQPPQLPCVPSRAISALGGILRFTQPNAAFYYISESPDHDQHPRDRSDARPANGAGFLGHI